ncbi:MAG: hypothetical protein AB7F32_00875 [Victivallaceae bacterium]
MQRRKLDLEVSLKPFSIDRTEAGWTAQAETIFRQWRPLIDDAQSVSLMFWAADGSEILEYDGNSDTSFEWAKWIGVANPHGYASDHPAGLKPIHEEPRLFMAAPPLWTYGDFKRLLDLLRAVFRREFGRELRLGATFDSGPEFAVSDFKYRRHPEICRGFCLGGKTFVCCYTPLHADPKPYAGWPGGIPEGTRFGVFFGRQAQRFLSDLGFDYIWFSNGFGFGMETWGVCGAVFDGEAFDPAGCGKAKEAMETFWRDFRRECPDFPVETRGTNLSTGMDLASDATPLREIYRDVKHLEVPPNSPWAALDGDFGLELAGWMSHIADLPAGKGFPFRFYTHDIWFMNSPWLDRYGRSPHDIYLPLSVARLNRRGETESPDALHILSIDDSFGRMPDQVPSEVIPYFAEMARTAPDQAGPLVWVYPFDEYHDFAYTGEKLEEIFAGDHLIKGALNAGFPLNTVISGGNFAAAPDEAFRDRILVVPTIFSFNAAVMAKLRRFLGDGGRVLFHGPARGEAIEELLGLAAAPPLAGDFTLTGDFEVAPRTVRHLALYSGGPLDRIAHDPSLDVLAEYVQNGERRVAAAAKHFAKGGLALWLRGSNSFAIVKNSHFPTPFDRSECFPAEELFRQSLKYFGYVIRFGKRSGDLPDPRLTLRMSGNALYFAGFGADTTVEEFFRFPDGAPVFTGCDLVLEDQLACYNVERAVNRECRVFVTAADGVITCREVISHMPGVKRRLRIGNLRDARVVFRPEPDHVRSVRLSDNAHGEANLTLEVPSLPGVKFETDGFGPKYIIGNFTGNLLISWGEKD